MDLLHTALGTGWKTYTVVSIPFHTHLLKGLVFTPFQDIPCATMNLINGIKMLTDRTTCWSKYTMSSIRRPWYILCIFLEWLKNTECVEVPGVFCRTFLRKILSFMQKHTFLLYIKISISKDLCIFLTESMGEYIFLELQIPSFRRNAWSLWFAYMLDGKKNSFKGNKYLVTRGSPFISSNMNFG